MAKILKKKKEGKKILALTQNSSTSLDFSIAGLGCSDKCRLSLLVTDQDIHYNRSKTAQNRKKPKESWPICIFEAFERQFHQA